MLYSVCLILVGCKSHYSGLKPTTSSDQCISKYGKADFESGWFSAAVDVYGKRITGLLLVKRSDDGSFRTVFTNEAGVTFFDFYFGTNGSFEVKKVASQLDRKPVINTLKNDFLLLTGLAFQNGQFNTWSDGESLFYGVRQKSGTAYFITSAECASLHRLESGSRKPFVSITFEGDRYNPASVSIRHLTFDMTISLKKLERE